MAVLTFTNPEAGPSTHSSKRVANFHSDSEDDLSTPLATPTKAKLTNGERIVKTNGKKRRVEGKRDEAEERKRRRDEAERLFEGRKGLPFYQGRKMILEEIMANETTIIIGETGCGKSTQLPQLLRQYSSSLSKYGSRGPRIAITQPRRLPAIALAQRVSAEMGGKLGEEVGYSVRFEDMTGNETRIRYLTEGVLMRELANPDSRRTGKVNGETGKAQVTNGGDHPNGNGVAQADGDEDPGGLNLLLRYDIIIIDEAHERTLNTDFLCGALKRVQRIRKRLVLQQTENASRGNGNGEASVFAKRPVRELKLVVMSATLDPGKFQRFFETGRDALLVKGRMYDVTTRHVVSAVEDYVEDAAKQVMQIHNKVGAEGDVLVFMPGSEEIENCRELLRRAANDLPKGAKGLEILPLYSALPAGAQAKIFTSTPPNTRRVIVATNIAETSITIPGIVYVIDTGYKKEKEFIFRTSGAMEHLAKKSISKAAAWQRTGRAGRERSGECYRLYTEKAYDALVEYDAPEIQRVNLASAVLQLVAMGLDPFTFEYIDNPGREPIAAAFQTLAGLGALNSPTAITPLGLDMLHYPLDPTHARILLASLHLDCPYNIINILSLLNSGGTIFHDRQSERDASIKARAKFIHRDGDHLTGLNVFNAYAALKEQGGGGNGSASLIAWCRDNYVNHRTMFQAGKVRDQLRDLVDRQGRDWRVGEGDGEMEGVVKSLLQGLFMNTAVIQPDGSYKQTAGSMIVKIHPSSVLMSKKVPAILYDELAITSSIYARNVTAFEQHWLSEVPWFQSAKGVTSNGTSR